MTTYAIATCVPKNRGCLTAGKRYEVMEVWEDGSFAIRDDNGTVLLLDLLPSVNNDSWTLVEGDEE